MESLHEMEDLKVSQQAFIVMDKSYLQGSNREQIQSLRSRCDVLITDTLLFELLSTDQEIRTHCFSHLGQYSYDFVALRWLLDYENKHQRRSCVSDHIKRGYFNSSLASGFFSLSSAQEELIDGLTAELDKELEIALELLEVAPKLFPDLRDYSPGSGRDIIDHLKERVARNDGMIVQSLYEWIRGEHLPPGELLDESWAFFRLLQADLIANLEFVSKYGFRCPGMNRERFANSLLDLKYVQLGVLAGGLATNDRFMSETFKLLCSSGVLVDLSLED